MAMSVSSPNAEISNPVTDPVSGAAFRPLRLGGLEVGFPVVQAALSGYSDWAMRVIARRLGAREYVNAPGGRELYDAAAFAGAGVRLLFLPEYRGRFASVLERLALESPDTLRAELEANLALEPAQPDVAVPVDPALTARAHDSHAPGFGTGRPR